MTREIESQLKQMFADLDEGFPAADFTTQVMSALMRARRRERMLLASAVLAVLAFVAFSFLYLQSTAGFSRTVLDVVGKASPLVYVYGMALGGYLLLRLTPRLRIRLF